jgi:hypothetical protein
LFGYTINAYCCSYAFRPPFAAARQPDRRAREQVLLQYDRDVGNATKPTTCRHAAIEGSEAVIKAGTAPVRPPLCSRQLVQPTSPGGGPHLFRRNHLHQIIPSSSSWAPVLHSNLFGVTGRLGACPR